MTDQTIKDLERAFVLFVDECTPARGYELWSAQKEAVYSVFDALKRQALPLQPDTADDQLGTPTNMIDAQTFAHLQRAVEACVDRDTLSRIQAVFDDRCSWADGLGSVR